MKKLITAICLSCILAMTSTHEIYAQVYSDRPYTYEYYYATTPVVLLNTVYCWHLFVDNHWIYRPIPSVHWHYIEYRPTHHHTVRPSHHYHTTPMPNIRHSNRIYIQNKVIVHKHQNNGLEWHRNRNTRPQHQRVDRR